VRLVLLVDPLELPVLRAFKGRLVQKVRLASAWREQPVLMVPLVLLVLMALLVLLVFKVHLVLVQPD
jgi:hypothetical protein